MDTSSVIETVFSSRKFQRILEEATRHTVLTDFQVIETNRKPELIDWHFALLCCSSMTSYSDERAQEAILRIAQCCLQQDLDKTIHDAAIVLLERLGNHRAVDLAISRGMIADDDWSEIPASLRLDLIRRRLELTIPDLVDEPKFRANEFQRSFWTTAQDRGWLSISAPTSAGKSHIVKMWIKYLAESSDDFRGVYLVPTRALIEEVTDDLQQTLADRVSIHSLPWDARIGTNPKEIFVVTQERLHLLQYRFPNLRIDLIFIDEAHKVGDSHRGVLLQQVLDETVYRSPNTQVIFASPLSENPELLLEGLPSGKQSTALPSSTVTVNQNLIWVNQVWRKPTRWTASIVLHGQELELGEFSLSSRPIYESSRLSLVAVALGRARPGNVVYVNGAADAEKIATQIADATGPDKPYSSDDDIQNLIELVQKTIHPNYALAEVLRSGVAFHYGNMPQMVKIEVERLFKKEKIRYLVCTSTLLEGVNLPCRNIFMRGPRKGRTSVMTEHDFWNLAGRAGRWGKEFQGNIVCVDTSIAERWPVPPTVRRRQPISRSIDEVFNDLDAFRAYVESGTPPNRDESSSTLESAYSLFASRVAQGRPLSEIAGVAGPDDVVRELEALVSDSISNLPIPETLISRHAGISPISIGNLWTHIYGYSNLDDLALPTPESRDAADAYAQAFSIIARYLGGTFGEERRQLAIAILVVDWMRGTPLSRLIGGRIRRDRNSSSSRKSIPTLIREVMSDVEQLARFMVPKYLGCYLDVIREVASARGTPFDNLTLPDVEMMLELGVSRTTELSLMSLGLSRTSTVSVGEYIMADDLSPSDVLDWMRQNNLSALELPTLVQRELQLLGANVKADESTETE